MAETQNEKKNTNFYCRDIFYERMVTDCTKSKQLDRILNFCEIEKTAEFSYGTQLFLGKQYIVKMGVLSALGYKHKQIFF